MAKYYSIRDNTQLENVVIANVLQLKGRPTSHPIPIRFNYDAHAKIEVAQPIRCRRKAFLLLIRYVML